MGGNCSVSKIKGVAGRIIAVYLVIFLLFGIVVSLTELNLKKIGRNTDFTAVVQVPGINMVNEMKTAIIFQQMYVKQYVDKENPGIAKISYREKERLINDRLNKLINASSDKSTREMLKKVKREYQEFTLVVNTIFKLDPGRTELTQVLMENYVITAENINTITDTMVQKTMQDVADSTLKTNALIDSMSSNNLLVSVIAIIAGLVTAWVLSSSISKPVNRLVSAIGALAKGELTQRVDKCGITEFDIVGDSFNQMVENLRTLVTRIACASGEVSISSSNLSQSATNVNMATREVAAGMESFVASGEQETINMNNAAEMLKEVNQNIEQIARRIQQQAENIVTSSEAITEVAAIATEVNSKAGHVNEVSGDIIAMAEAGGDTVEKAVSGMEEIKSIVSKSSNTIEALVKQSEEIGMTVQMIAEIADQTNLLALNARIEAARAGEAGKGFAVIADQVRILADKSRQATQQVADSVNTVQAGINNAAAAMDQITYQTDRGGTLVEDAGQVLRRILKQVSMASAPIQEISILIHDVTNKTGQAVVTMNSVAELARNNANASQDTAEKATEITRLVNQVSNTLQGNVCAASEVSKHTENISQITYHVAEAAEYLLKTSKELQGFVSQFRLDNQGGV